MVPAASARCGCRLAGIGARASADLNPFLRTKSAERFSNPSHDFYKELPAQHTSRLTLVLVPSSPRPGRVVVAGVASGALAVLSLATLGLASTVVLSGARLLVAGLIAVVMLLGAERLTERSVLLVPVAVAAGGIVVVQVLRALPEDRPPGRTTP